MSVNVRIKQKSLFKKKINIDDIIRISNLSYGVCDENYRLIENEKADHTLLYDKNRLARGIDISFDKNDILLLLSLPTTKKEIRMFYNIIEKICSELKLKNYIREEELVSIDDSEKFIKYDEEGSIGGLEDLQKRIEENEYSNFEIFGIYNPISIGLKEIHEIDKDLDNLDELLHRLQSKDVYYAVPRVYKVKDKLVGIYAIGPNIPSVIPLKPYIILNQIKGINDWFVMLKEGKTIKYDDLINNVKTQEYYDVNHVIIALSEKEITDLVEKFYVEI